MNRHSRIPRASGRPAKAKYDLVYLAKRAHRVERVRTMDAEACLVEIRKTAEALLKCLHERKTGSVPTEIVFDRLIHMNREHIPGPLTIDLRRIQDCCNHAVHDQYADIRTHGAESAERFAEDNVDHTHDALVKLVRWYFSTFARSLDELPWQFHTPPSRSEDSSLIDFAKLQAAEEAPPVSDEWDGRLPVKLTTRSDRPEGMDCVELVTSLWSRNEFEDACRKATAYAKQRPRSATALVLLAECYVTLQRVPEAVDRLCRAADLLERARRYPDAIRVLERIANLDHTHRETFMRLFQLYQRDSDWRRAERTLNRYGGDLTGDPTLRKMYQWLRDTRVST